MRPPPEVSSSGQHEGVRNCSSMDKERNLRILAYVLCALIVVSAWVICFLPTVFFMNPVTVPEQEKPLSNISFRPSRPCNPPLIFSNNSGFCEPPCDWLPFSNDGQEAMVVADWITAIFCTTCFCFVLTTWLKLRELMRFPHIIILLMAGSGATIVFLVVIPKFGNRSTFFCSSIFLDEAIKNPTLFCTIHGVLIHYISLVIGEMFVVSNALLFKNLVIDKLPSLEHKKKKLIVMSIVGLLLPIIPIIYVLMSDVKYVQVHLRYCAPGNIDEAFYSFVLPNQLFLSVGISCLLIVIFKLIKERKSSLMASPIQAKARQIKLQKAAVGFVIVIISYIVCVYLTYGLICIQLRNAQAYKKTLIQYFTCLIFSKDCPKDFLNYESSSTLLVISFLAGNVFQAATLGLLASKPKARNLWRTWIARCAPKCCKKSLIGRIQASETHESGIKPLNSACGSSSV